MELVANFVNYSWYTAVKVSYNVERLKSVMSSLVHPNQVAYVKSRFINEGIWTIEEPMQFKKAQNIEACGLSH